MAVPMLSSVVMFLGATWVVGGLARPRTRRPARTLPALVSLAIFSPFIPVARATVSVTVPYDVKHTFNTRLVGNQTYRVQWQYFAHAIAKGSDGMGGTITDDQKDQGTLAPGLPAHQVKPVVAVAPGALAFAVSEFEANLDGTGFARIFGGGDLTSPPGLRVASEASSIVALNRGVTQRDGSVKWGPEWKYVTAATGRLGDPIDVSFIDLDNGTTLSSRLFDLELNFLGLTGGSSNYTNGDLTISGREGNFRLSMDSPYITSGTGTIELAFANGLVTQADATGIFAGILPAVGSPSSAIAFHLGDAMGAFDIGFDYGTDPNNVNGYEFQGVYGNSAFVEAIAPEPGTFVLAGTGIVGAGLAGLRRRRR